MAEAGFGTKGSTGNAPLLPPMTKPGKTHATRL
ncbi:hypothetical protein NX02_01775 [Sphingomonas sanxanigenens DSM 19645 = NX02]|uniref:Uncharacterized protein n=1 Tax=Sphingomonas sanxanigenens DSM 19645 = NX02 TaxID=1123269 RepID=W0A6L6_9SPHN|nr:hypothetical protein NX02_01775 [Sphingomonas sanxanigenens DSM 19645 = NX02]